MVVIGLVCRIYLSYFVIRQQRRQRLVKQRCVVYVGSKTSRFCEESFVHRRAHSYSWHATIMPRLRHLGKGGGVGVGVDTSRRRRTHRVHSYLRQPPPIATGLSSTQNYPTRTSPNGKGLPDPEGRHRLLTTTHMRAVRRCWRIGALSLGNWWSVLCLSRVREVAGRRGCIGIRWWGVRVR